MAAAEGGRAVGCRRQAHACLQRAGTHPRAPSHLGKGRSTAVGVHCCSCCVGATDACCCSSPFSSAWSIHDQKARWARSWRRWRPAGAGCCHRCWCHCRWATLTGVELRTAGGKAVQDWVRLRGVREGLIRCLGGHLAGSDWGSRASARRCSISQSEAQHGRRSSSRASHTCMLSHRFRRPSSTSLGSRASRRGCRPAQPTPALAHC